MITDIHCHFIPGRYFELAQARPEFGVRRLATPGERVDLECRGLRYGLNRTFFEPSLQIARMDALGIARSVVSLATPMVDYRLDEELAVTAARICNDGFAELVAAHPRRFLAWAYLPMQHPQRAAEELTRCVRELGFIGGHLATNVGGAYLPELRFRPVFDAAAGLGVPLFLHPANPPGQDRTGDYELTVVAGYLFDSTINILRMIASNFLDRYGSLNLVCAHAGAYSLMLRSRMQREVDTNAVLAASLPRKVGDYLRSLYFDTVCFEPGYLQFAATVVPVENLLLGSDAPFPLGEPDPVGFVRRSLSPDRADLALATNFHRLTGR